ncbi:MAG: alpha/beta fold hydrolase [Flavobacteriales bacterium]|nr:alpha/beta fold hydrolase [Flavobacteriales bacterium]MCB9167890.1 alpha/beta fold hydrolase [Flavobacteriales bacterium]
MWPILIILGLLLVLYTGLCAVYYLIQERLIFVRFIVDRNHRFKFRGDHEEVEISRPDGAQLHALHFHVATPRGVVLYFHGNTGSLRRWGKRAPRFTKQGWDVLMPDPRGYGKSRGRLSERALIDDAHAWYAHLQARWPERDIVLYGRSLGSAFAVPVAATGSPRALVLESPFADLIDVARHYFAYLPYGVLLKYRFDNATWAERLRCPTHIFHGMRDQVVPYASALRLYSAIPAGVPREMISFSKGHHSDLARFARFHRVLRAVLRGEEAGGE